jgi:DNA modification methylase
LIWDAVDGCLHEWGNKLQHPTRKNRGQGDDPKYSVRKTSQPTETNTQYCQKCNAWRGSFGLEPTPELYVKHTVDIFREIWRVLKKDGTVWLNLGDSYSGSGGTSGQGPEHTNFGKPKTERMYATERNGFVPNGLKRKDLVGIPWRVAFALQTDGWYLRSDIIWHKPNPMPESVKDRPTKAHEYIFLLTKSVKYFYDADAIAEKSIDPESFTGRRKRNPVQMEKHDAKNCKMKIRNKMTGKLYPKKNKRTVWTVPTKPFAEAHFATFPPDLIVDCIKAGCPENGIVLDPFAGSGTTCEVSLRLDRKYVGIELNPKYIKIANKRLYKHLLPSLLD